MGKLHKWKVLSFIYIFMLVFAVIFQGLPPVFGFIISSLGISHAQAGALMSFLDYRGFLFQYRVGFYPIFMVRDVSALHP